MHANRLDELSNAVLINAILSENTKLVTQTGWLGPRKVCIKTDLGLVLGEFKFDELIREVGTRKEISIEAKESCFNKIKHLQTKSKSFKTFFNKDRTASRDHKIKTYLDSAKPKNLHEEIHDIALELSEKRHKLALLEVSISRVPPGNTRELSKKNAMKGELDAEITKLENILKKQVSPIENRISEINSNLETIGSNIKKLENDFNEAVDYINGDLLLDIGKKDPELSDRLKLAAEKNKNIIGKKLNKTLKSTKTLNEELILLKNDLNLFMPHNKPERL